MNYIDLPDNSNRSNTMDNYGTETSATSSFNPSELKGGAWPFGSENYNRLGVEACNERNLGALSFLITKRIVTDFSVKDPRTGDTVLHCIAKFSNDVPNLSEVLNIILNDPKRESFINIQNNEKQTPLHVALDRRNQELVNLFIKAGGDPKIRDKAKRYITNVILR